MATNSYISNALNEIREKLLDTSKRNKLLNFRRNKSSLVIVGRRAEQVFERLVRDGKSMLFKSLPEPEEKKEGEDSVDLPKTKEQLVAQAARYAEIDIREELPPVITLEKEISPVDTYKNLQMKLFMPELEKRLRRIRSKANSIIQETGQNQLYLALGFLQWRAREDVNKTYEAPLVLIPIKIKKGRIDAKTRCYHYSVQYTGEDLIPNLSLAEKLKREFNLVLPDFEDEEVVVKVNGHYEVDLEKYFKAVAVTIENMKGWKVSRKIEAGFFTFAKLLMYLDLDPNRWPIADHKIIQELLEGREPTSGTDDEVDLNEDKSIESLPLVADADSSQTKAIAKALNGTNMIIQGPPGTGKSQTITNLIASFMNQGKSVLFIAEKMAALEVVHRNLENVGLSDFCLELHSHRVNKKKVVENLSKRNKRRFSNTSSIDAHSVELQRLRENLGNYVELIQSCVGPNGETLFDVFWKVEQLRAQLQGQPSLSVDNIGAITPASIEVRSDLLKELSLIINNIGNPRDNVWYGYYPVEFNYGDQAIVQNRIESIRQSANNITDKAQDLFTALNLETNVSNLTVNHLESITELGKHSIPDGLLSELIYPFILCTDIAPWEAFKVSIDAYKKNFVEASEYLNTSKGFSLEEITKVIEITNFVEKAGLTQLNLKATNDLIDTCKKMLSSFESIKTVSSKYNQIVDGLPNPITMSDLEDHLKLDSLIRAKPLGIDATIAENLFSRPFREVIEEVIVSGSEIQDERKRLSVIFDLSLLPSIKELISIRKVLRQCQTKKLAFLRSDYRKAKKILSAFLRDNSKANDGRIIDELEKLESMVNAIEDFSNKKVYPDTLGQLFNGIDTNINTLKEIFSWSAHLHAATNSLTLSRQLAGLEIDYLENWPDRYAIENQIKLVKELTDIFAELTKDTSWEHQLYDMAKKPFDVLINNLSELQELLVKALDSISPIVLRRDYAFSQIKIASAAFIQAKKISNDIENNHEIRTLLDCHFQGVDTDTTEIDKTLDWLLEVNLLKLPDELIDILSSKNIHELLSLIKNNTLGWEDDLKEIRSGLDSLEEFGTLEHEKLWGGSIASITIGSFDSKLEKLAKEIDRLVYWASYSRLIQDAKKLGLGHIIELVEQGELHAGLAEKAYLNAVYTSIVKKVLRQHPELSTFTKSQFENKRRRFAVLDKKLQKLVQEKFAHSAQRDVPPGISRGPVRDKTQLALLKNEFAKERRHLPIRQLMKRAGDAIRALKPVFMMSPRSVAQFLEPGAHEFDVVIMDEASQIQPHEALGSIARSKQMIIVGDSKQLPPTTFFDTTLNDSDEDDREELAIDDMDSVLDMADGSNFPSEPLLWHYRSEHESLIAFSNTTWYDDKLIVFPSPDSSGGLRFNYIEGATYMKGKNEKEADYVAHKIIEHARRSPELSLGVGTLNAKQRELIEDQLEKRTKEDASANLAVEKLMKAHDGSEPLFIKNLENLQGDQRDVIFISCTFGPDRETGHVYQRFGPINNKNGWKRLNVLFTRAKKKMEIFSSMKPEDIRAGSGDSEGAIALRNFLKYAQTGQLPDLGIKTGHEPDSDFEIAVARELSNAGYKVEPQVGVAGYRLDIGVYHPQRPGEYILGIECDGATYHSSRFARDRDRLREEVLNKRGWNIFRIWSTDWFNNRDLVIKDLKEELRMLVELDEQVVREEISVETPIVPIESIIEQKRLSDEELYDLLLEYRKLNISKKEISPDDSILRDEMIKCFVKLRPTSKEEYIDTFSVSLRAETEPDENQYLDNIFMIIEQAEGLECMV